MATVDDLYQQGTSYTEVIKNERKLREVAEEQLNRRLLAIEDRLCIVDRTVLSDEYPDLVEAYERFREEEAKVGTFEALKDSK